MANSTLPPNLKKLVDRKDWDGLGTELAGCPSRETAGVLLGLDEAARTRVCEAMASGPLAKEPDFLRESYTSSVRRRVGWLIVLLIGQMFTANVLDYFDEQLEKALVLALFVPMIISSGGNSGSQASTLLIRAMALGQVRLRDWLKVLGRELVIGLLLGLILGAFAFGRIAIVQGKYPEHWMGIGITIGLSTMAVVLVGTLLGSALPLLMRLIRTDPATSSAPFVATLCDICGLILYFLIAMAILKGTLL